MNIAVVGAGISGVTLAYLLSEKKKRGANIEITVFEAEAESGGCIKTIVSDGFMLESGPNGILNSREHVRRILDGGGLLSQTELSSPLTKRRYLEIGGALLKAPQGVWEAIATPILTFQGKLRILKEPFIPPKTDFNGDESVFDFAERRLGSEAAEKLIATLVGGVFAGDAKKLSMSTSFPRLYELEKEHGSLLKGMFARIKGKKSERHARPKDSYKLISTSNGMKGFVDLLENAVTDVSFRYQAPIKSVFKNLDGGYTVTSIGSGVEVAERYDAVALCCNAKAISLIIGNIAPKLSAEFAKISFAPVFMVGFGIDRTAVSHPLDGFGYLVNYVERAAVLGTLFSSTLFKGRAPEGRVMLSVIGVGDGRNDYFLKSDEELSELIFQSVKKPLGITGAPQTVLSFRTENAIPQYYAGHRELINLAEEAMREHRGIYIGGNSLYGISVSDCMKRSLEIAESIESFSARKNQSKTESWQKIR
ncbi:MAG: protoporphyrinogen oxidase [Deferribacteraceae bacterium]|nr:protoporphyrinogen oxidase [Deferribacteraceae bacterium]